MIKKIGIINCSHISNFGSVLQSFAIEKVVREITGYETYSIRYKQRKDIKYLKNYLPLLFEKDIVLFKLKSVNKKLYLKFCNKQLKKKCEKREEKFEKFRNENFNYTKVYTSLQELEEMSKEFKCIVLGSDQVWHPINYGSHYYTMEWVSDETKKITYAASFGVNRLPDYQINGTKNFLKRINCLSVREQQGAILIDNLINEKVPVVVDPTILISKDEWDKVSSKEIEEKDYIFCYFLGNNKAARMFAETLKCKTGKKIYSIPGMDEINLSDLNFGDEQLYNIGPAEFISYIKNAYCVITDSFHGTVFSILYNKQFIVYNRFEDCNKGSTNSRIDTLLEWTGLKGRRIINDSAEKAVDTILQPIDYGMINSKVEKQRCESFNYLKKALTKD